jgi:hypothetical protein
MVSRRAGTSVTRLGAIRTIFGRVACSILVASALQPGCGSSSPPARPDATAAPAVTDAGPGTADAPALPPIMTPPVPPNPGEPPDAIRRADGPPPQTCGAIRNCVVVCATDSACAQRCIDSAAAAARTDYQKVVTCSRQYCQPNDINCRCEQECYTEGMCLESVDGCRDFELDLFCDELCM